jgi:hypothetical protein
VTGKRASGVGSCFGASSRLVILPPVEAHTMKHAQFLAGWLIQIEGDVAIQDRLKGTWRFSLSFLLVSFWTETVS